MLKRIGMVIVVAGAVQAGVVAGVVAQDGLVLLQ
jgi:hypothetical protein